MVLLRNIIFTILSICFAISNEDYIIITISDYAEAAEIISNTHSNDSMGVNKLTTKIIYLDEIN